MANARRGLWLPDERRGWNPKGSAELLPHGYVLAVHDFAGSTRYFVDVLGFTKEWNNGESWQGLLRGQVRLMLGHCPGALAPRELGDHNYFGFFVADNVDALFTKC